ncbi:hypothetical protein CEXT_727671 [Caerostris extrusa]|uniref:Uncharacterized protein n=1 Tax=Caerostris extrusa TaxID=172846 RepID=A0AAV4TRC6_CAEEX|nr:hypothetical protein CEXT_727671 [Caerostris extrusa]
MTPSISTIYKAKKVSGFLPHWNNKQIIFFGSQKKASFLLQGSLPLKELKKDDACEDSYQNAFEQLQELQMKIVEKYSQSRYIRLPTSQAITTVLPNIFRTESRPSQQNTVCVLKEFTRYSTPFGGIEKVYNHVQEPRLKNYMSFFTGL